MHEIFCLANQPVHRLSIFTKKLIFQAFLLGTKSLYLFVLLRPKNADFVPSSDIICCKKFKSFEFNQIFNWNFALFAYRAQSGEDNSQLSKFWIGAKRSVFDAKKVA